MAEEVPVSACNIIWKLCLKRVLLAAVTIALSTCLASVPVAVTAAARFWGP